MALTFSIVINTLNRGSSLKNTLDSLRWLKYEGDFEVIVVNGPSTDDTDEVLSIFTPFIRIGYCHIANLSVSRNIGICMAQGDIVVFLDDDAIPEPEWLTQLAAGYDMPDVGGVGGIVFDHTGYAYQYQYSTATRLGNACFTAKRSCEHLCFPGSFEFPYLQGTNASFRRSALHEVGGFDEEIEYYLDETDLCCRLIDQGYILKQLSNGYVHHKFAPSHIRDDHRITRYRFPVIKNKIYFSLKHGRDYLSLEEILANNILFSNGHKEDIAFHVNAGRLDNSEHARFANENEMAWDVGVAAGMSSQQKLITADTVQRWQGEFFCFPTIINCNPKNIVLISRDFPPDHNGGIATFVYELAKALSSRGHIVHVVTQSTDINRVDLDNGVWVHRITIDKQERTTWATENNVPEHIFAWSATALKETLRIETHRHIDVVEAPIWDCEGVAFLEHRFWPLVTSLHTTLKIWLDNHSDYSCNPDWMNSFGIPMLKLEKYLMTNSDAVRANSYAIIGEIEKRYDFLFDQRTIKMVAHGMQSKITGSRNVLVHRLEVLFVGRLEPRKGIDILLNSIPSVMNECNNIYFRIIGDKSIPVSGSLTYEQIFRDRYINEGWFDRVVFEGKVSQDVLDDAYHRCDIFVAPSRFESFGLIFIEAMREGKPVIGCSVGGVPEVVSHGVNGMLIDQENVEQLCSAIIMLARDEKLRRQMGEAGRNIFEKNFTADRMAEESEELYNIAIDRNFFEAK